MCLCVNVRPHAQVSVLDHQSHQQPQSAAASCMGRGSGNHTYHPKCPADASDYMALPERAAFSPLPAPWLCQSLLHALPSLRPPLRCRTATTCMLICLQEAFDKYLLGDSPTARILQVDGASCILRASLGMFFLQFRSL